MNSNRTSPIRVIGAAIVAFVAYASIASPAFAVQAPGGGDAGSCSRRCGVAPTTTGAASVSPSAVPIAAINGMTIAQYVQRHQADDPRTVTTV